MEYFIIENGQQAGPFTLDQLATKHITQETLVWHEGMADWAPAWRMDELKAILFGGTSTNVPPVPPVPPSPTPSSSAEHGNEGRERKKKNKHLLPKIFLAVVAVLVIILALTNPSKDDHRTAVKEQVNKLIDKTSQDSFGGNDIFSMGMRTIAKMISGSVMDVAFDNFFEYHNYIIFSKGTVNYEGQDHNVSFGILGNVYTLNADDMVKAIEDNQENVPEEKESSQQEENTDSDVSAQNSSANSLEEKADEMLDKVSDRVSKKVEEKINKKLDELKDSSTIDKILDKIMDAI